MKSSKAQILAKFHKIPVLRFEDQQLTSFSGLLVFQQLFHRIQKRCYALGQSQSAVSFTQQRDVTIGSNVATAKLRLHFTPLTS